MNRYLEDYKKAIETLITLENEELIDRDWRINNDCKMAFLNSRVNEDSYFEFDIEELADIDFIRKKVKGECVWN